MLLGLLLTLNIIVCLALIGVVLLQRSEGGALGGGGGPTGLVTTRGAGDLLTRTTWILFAAFLGLSLALTLIGGREHSDKAVIDRLKLAPGGPVALPPANKASSAPGLAPGQTPPPPVSLPGFGGAPAPAGQPAQQQRAAHTAPSPNLDLPPLGGPAPSNAPAKPPAP